MMKTHTDKTPENKSRSTAHSSSKGQSTDKATFQFKDNRPETMLQRKLYHMGNNSAMESLPVQKKSAIEEEELLQGKFEPIQKQKIEEEELLQGKFKAAQRQELEEEELLQGKFEPHEVSGKAIQKKVEPERSRRENSTGLPDNLKSGIESLSGYAMDDVKVHYKSDKPAQLNAHAYAQGTDIHLASGQEKHLPHEAWHVVQQKQGRVKPTFQMKGNVNVNDDIGLEREADVMGEKALQMRLANKGTFKIHFPNEEIENEPRRPINTSGNTKNDKENRSEVIQRLVGPDLVPKTKVFIQRSTERGLHNAEAIIFGLSDNINSYEVQVVETGQIYTLRFDQLSLMPSAEKDNHPLQVEIGEIAGRNSVALKNDAVKEVSQQLGLKPGSFVLGGSFAVLIHAFEKGEPARTPRDIDILVNPKIFRDLKAEYKPRSSSRNPFPTNKELWGIPIEIHINDDFGVDLTLEEKKEGIESKNKLLEKYLKRIGGIPFGPQVKKARKRGSATKILSYLEKSNTEVLRSNLPEESKMKWIKTLEDIRHLVNAGAQYKEDESMKDTNAYPLFDNATLDEKAILVFDEDVIHDLIEMEKPEMKEDEKKIEQLQGESIAEYNMRLFGFN